MINQNARRTGAAGVMARALGTLGAATLLLTSTGWGALAGNTGFGAINLKAYQGAASAVPGPSAGDAAKAGGDDLAWWRARDRESDALNDAMRNDFARRAEENFEREQRELRHKPLEKLTPNEAFDLFEQWEEEWAKVGEGSGTTTAPAAGSGSSVGGSNPTTGSAPGSGSSVGGSNPTTGSAPGSGSSVASSGPTTTTTAALNLPPLQASTDTPAEAAEWKAADAAKEAAYAAQADYQAALDEKTDIYFAYKYDHLTPAQSARIGSGGYDQFMAMLEQNIDARGKKVDQAWAAYTEAQKRAAAVARQARGGRSQ